MPTHAAPTAEQLRHAWRYVSRPGWPDTLEQALQTQPYRTCLHGIARNLSRARRTARPTERQPMTWMLTATGAQFDLRCIALDQISILDIAHSLAQLNRYTGHARRPYSVAEHSLLVVELLERHSNETAEELLAALLHDAHEAYTADLSSPMKQVLGDAWHAEEDRIQAAVLGRFGVLGAFQRRQQRIKWADLTALSTERHALLPPTGPVWPATSSHPPVDWVDFNARARFTWEDWRQAYLDKVAELRFHMALGRAKGAA